LSSRCATLALPGLIVCAQVWQQVKAANPGFSICEIGATIGRMWRELSDEEKQRHMEDFTKDKVSTISHRPP